MDPSSAIFYFNTHLAKNRVRYQLRYRLVVLSYQL